MALLAFTNTFLCLTSWAVSFFSLANSFESLANSFSELANYFESLANCFSELANCFRQLLITMPWFRLRHHFRHFFRQFISSDMMIFQIDMVQRKGERLPVLYPCPLLPPYCCGAVLWLNGLTYSLFTKTSFFLSNKFCKLYAPLYEKIPQFAELFSDSLF